MTDLRGVGSQKWPAVNICIYPKYIFGYGFRIQDPGSPGSTNVIQNPGSPGSTNVIVDLSGQQPMVTLSLGSNLPDAGCRLKQVRAHLGQVPSSCSWFSRSHTYVLNLFLFSPSHLVQTAESGQQHHRECGWGCEIKAERAD